MSSSNYRITLDMQSNQSQASLPVRLNDTNRRLYIILTNGGSPYIIEEGSYAVFMGNKPDGNSLVNDCTIGEDSVICYEFTEQTANVSGVVDCEIRLYDIDGKVITSPRFIFVVDERVIYDEEILSKYEGTTLDYILGSEMARQFAESDRAKAELQRQKQEAERTSAETLRANAEELRLFAEEGRVKAEEQRVIAEGVREGNETYRSKCESDRQAAEREREQASATMTSMFNIIIGKNNSYDVDSLGAVPNHIFTNLATLKEGDVIAIANNDFDLICMGSATDEEMNTLTCYRFNDFLFGNITMTAGGTYIFVNGISRKFLATTEKFKLPIGQEEMDAHNNSEEAHSDIRFKADAAYSLAGEAHEKATRVKEQCDKDIKELKSTQESTSNAIKGKVTGEVVRVNDVSPIEHTVKCRARSKNLIPYPYEQKEKTANGITFTVNSDGTITVNGTATDSAAFHLGTVALWGEPVFVSGCPQDGGMQKYRITADYFVGGSYISSVHDTGEGGAIPSKCDVVKPYILVYPGMTFTNFVFKPQIEIGTAATEYAPYVDPSTATVTRCGKNLILYPYQEKTKTMNGITFTVNSDGTITANGTATEGVGFHLGVAYITNGKVMLSGCPKGGDMQKYRITGDCYKGDTFVGSVFDIGDGASVLHDCDNVRTYLYIFGGVTVDNLVFKPQLEVGSVVTEYEPYKEKTAFAPGADGTVVGIKSYSPSMILFTDTANVVVEIEYNQDINVLNRKLVEALDAILKIQETLIGGTSQ